MLVKNKYDHKNKTILLFVCAYFYSLLYLGKTHENNLGKDMNLLHRITYSKPPPYLPSLIANLFGAQLVMIGVFSFLHFIKGKRSISKEYKEYLNALEEDGVAIIPNFLPTDIYLEIQNEYESLLPKFEPSIPYANSSLSLPHVERIDLDKSLVSDTVRNQLLDNPLIISIARAFLRRKNFFDVRAYMTRVYLDSQKEVDMPQNGGTNNIHMDAPLRVLKFFYFINNGNEKNGTLYYAKRSHKRNTLRRLWFEYLLSVQYAYNKRKTHPEGEYDAGEPWVAISEQDLRKLNLSIKPLCVKGNTLVIANVGGFHRRGNFTEPGERRTIEISFRGTDILKNYIKGFFS